MRRGTALLATLVVLTLLLLVMGVMARLLFDDLGETRRRANAMYAAELARSGIAWAMGAVGSAHAFQPETLKVAGGEVEIRLETKDDGLRIVSTGRVVSGRSVLATREEALDVGTPVRHVDAPPVPPVVPAEDPVVVE
jgi:type II secretory pathway pseudopilin PulG